MIEGLPKSTLHEFSHKLSFVPAGHQFYGWQKPRVLPRFTYLFLDPKSRLLDTELRLSEISLRPRLFFFDQDLWDSTLKLKAQVGQDNGSAYAEALALFLVPARTLRVQQPIGWVRSCYLVVQRIVMGRRQDALVVYAFSISIALLVAS